MVLSDAHSGTEAQIAEIQSGCELFKRLAAMGLAEGTMLRVILNRGKGPVLVESSGRKIAIGRGMAECILIADAL